MICNFLLNFHGNCWFVQTDFLLKCWDRSGAKACKSCRSWKVLSNAYFVAKFHFDAAENEPAKNLRIFAKSSAVRSPISPGAVPEGAPKRGRAAWSRRRGGPAGSPFWGFRCARRPATSATRRPIGKISAKCCSISAVSAPIFASKYAFSSICWDLQDYLADFFEIGQIFGGLVFGCIETDVCK